MDVATTIAIMAIFALAGIGFLAFSVYVFRGIGPAKRETAELRKVMLAELWAFHAVFLRDNTGVRIAIGCAMAASGIASLVMAVLLGLHL